VRAGPYVESGTPAVNAPRLPAATPLRDALSAMLDAGANEAAIVDAEGKPLGRVTLQSIQQAAAVART
jgi:osmoprotectant transport system ATP-binding protein